MNHVPTLFIVYLVVLRGMALLISAMLVYIGYRLYNDNVKPMTSAEFKASGFTFKATKLGPGVVFAIAGALGVWKSFEIPASLAAPIAIQAEEPPASDRSLPNGTIEIAGAGGGGTREFALISLDELASLDESLLALRNANLSDDARFLSDKINSIVGLVIFKAVGDKRQRVLDLNQIDADQRTTKEQEFLDRYGRFFVKPDMGDPQ